MSRCFPFPPPGYDKKPRPEDVNVLKEGKDKEKKHKKDKKDKEKKEGKEKRDKERSDEKHREKKDRKEKQKDKKDKHREKKDKDKEKAKGKDKEKISTSEASRVAHLPEAKSGEKLSTKEGKDISYWSDEKSRAAKFHGQNGEKPVQSNLLSRESEESKVVQELDKRIRDEEKVTSNQLVESLSGAERKRDNETQKFAVRNHANVAEDKGKIRDKLFDNKKMDEQGIREEVRITGNSMVQSLAGTAKAKVEGMPRAMDKNEERLEGKEKAREKDDKRRDKHKDKDRDKKDRGKDKDREKERKKVEKVKEKNEPDKTKNVNGTDLIDLTDKKSSKLLPDHNNGAKIEGNLKKRKEIDINGFLHDTEVRPDKLLRPAPHPVMENGRQLEAHQSPDLFTSDKQGVPPNLKVERNKHRRNGIVESRSLPASSIPKPPSVTADQIVEASRKPPHPDTKYLSEVLSVPKMDEWSAFDDQEWLFGSQGPPSRRSEVDSFGVGEEPQVWSEALHIESADIVALPYVLPY